LDKGSQLNKTVVSFDNLQEITPVVTGIVLHKQNPMGYSFDADAGYIAYADSTENAANNNGVIYIGAVFPATVKGAFAQVFSEKERKERGDALGHVLAVNDYEPGAEYIYYWGIKQLFLHPESDPLHSSPFRFHDLHDKKYPGSSHRHNDPPLPVRTHF
jgi:hypothetical protein